jgi:hypothetical protein
MKQIIVLIIIFMIGIASGYGLSIEDTLINALNELRLPGQDPLIISFDTFTYADKKISSDFSRYLESQLAAAFQKTPQFELFARNELEKILEAQELNLSDLTGDKDIPKIGTLANVRGLLSGRFYDAETNIQVFLDLANIETGTYYGNTTFYLSKKEVPKSVSLLPNNYNNALNVLEQLKNINESEATQLKIMAWCKRGNGGTYVKGEDLVVHFYSNMDCYIKIYHINVNNDLKLIFPNQFHTNNKIKKETVYSIPDDSYGFSFELTEPFGTEFIKVMASTEQFRDIEESFTSLGSSSTNVLSRGLTLKQKKGKLAETMFSYTILEE